MPTSDDKRQNDEYDTPWKEILHAYFKDFMAFFLPEAHDGIDWQRGYIFLDKELASITREAEIGDRRMDKLVRVWRRGGEDWLVFIHIEIQGKRQTNFPERMYSYHHRTHDLHKKPVVSLAVLADDESGWRPSEYRHELWGTQLFFRFTTVKLLDYLADRATLATSNNPFAIVTLAHLHAKQTKNRTEDRYQIKLHLIRSLYQRGFNRQQVIDLFRFIDWVLRLPEDADNRLWTEIATIEENQKMPYLSSVERMGIKIGEERGILIGRQEQAAATLLRLLRGRFGKIASWVEAKVAAAEVEELENWTDKTLHAKSLEKIFGGVPRRN